MNYKHKAERRFYFLQLPKSINLGLKRIFTVFVVGAVFATQMSLAAPILREPKTSTISTIQSACSDAYSIGQAISRQRALLDSLSKSTPTRFAPLRIPLIYTRYRKAYDDLYNAARRFDFISRTELAHASAALNAGDTANACKYLNWSLRASNLETQIDSEAVAVYNLHLSGLTAVLRPVADFGNEVGSALLTAYFGPEVGASADILYARLDYEVDRSLVGEDEALRNFRNRLLVMVADQFLNIRLAKLGNESINGWLTKKAVRPFIKSKWIAGLIKEAVKASGGNLTPALSRRFNDILSDAAFNYLTSDQKKALVDRFVSKLIYFINEAVSLDDAQPNSPQIGPSMMAYSSLETAAWATSETPSLDVLDTYPAESGDYVLDSLSNVSITFTDPVQAGSLAIDISEAGGKAVRTSSVLINSGTVTIYLATRLNPNTNYIVTVQAGALLSLSGVANDRYVWTFTTIPSSLSMGITAIVSNTANLGLNLRAGPSLTAAKIATMSEGTQVNIVSGPIQADGYRWYNVTTNGQAGWCAVGEWLVTSDSQGPRAGAQVTVSNTNGLGLQLRNAPGVAAGVITTLAEGTSLTVINGPYYVDGYLWWNVSGNAGSGYSAAAPWLFPYRSSDAKELVINSLGSIGVQAREWGESITFSVKVTDANGYAVGGAIVSGVDDLRASGFQATATDNNGQTSYTTTVPTGKPDGTYNVSFSASKQGSKTNISVIQQVTVSHLANPTPTPTPTPTSTPTPTPTPSPSPSPPTITGYSWTSTPTSGQPFNGTITGTGFVINGTQVWFCQAGTNSCYQHPAAGVSVTNANSLNVSNVNLSAGSWQIYVVTSAGQSARSSTFTVQAAPSPPTITGYSWTSTPIGGQPFNGTITGTGFVINGTQVWFCQAGTNSCYQHPAAGVSVTNANSLNVSNVNLSSGSWQFYLQTSVGQSARSTVFTVR